MGIEDLGLLLENIEEYVMEQKKVVTYKWLSRTFSLNVNQAKQLLAIFHMKHKNMKHRSLQGVYYVSGMRTNSQGVLTHQVCIVNEDMLEATKAQLDPITSVHLYSVQKGKPKDTAPIYNVDFEQLKKKVYETTEFSMVRCKEAKISQVINNSLRPVTPPALKNKVKVMKPATKSDSKAKTFSATARKSTATKKPVETKKSTSKKQENLANFFGKGRAETKNSEPKRTVPKPDESKKVDLGRAETKNSEPKRTVPKPDESKKEIKKSETKRTSPRKTETTTTAKKSEVKKSVCAREPLFVGDIVEQQVVEISKPKPNGKGCRRGAAGTKRKRVMQFSDDEEDNNQTKIEDEGICLEEDPEEVSKGPITLAESPDSKKPKVRRKRVKKLVSKTSLNEDGFMETEKVWETVSCTDDDEEEKEEEVKMETEETPKKQDPAPPVRNKQSNLMGFFKKS